MSVETKCSECGEWYGIGTSHKVGEPCRMCRSKAGAIPGQSLSEYQHQECVRLQREQSGTHVIPLGAPMVPGRKLTEALLCAGRYSDLAAHDAAFEAKGLTEALLEAGKKHGHEDIKFDCRPEFSSTDPLGVVRGEPLVKLSFVDEANPSFIRLIGSIAWRLLLVMVVVGVIVAVLAGGRV